MARQFGWKARDNATRYYRLARNYLASVYLLAALVRWI
jgi:hypothetical protein